MLEDVLVVELVDAHVGHFLARRAHGVAYHGRGHLWVERFLVIARVFQCHAHGLYGHLLQAGYLRGHLGWYLVAYGIEFKAFDEAAYLGIGLVRGFVVFRKIEFPVPAVGRHFAYAVAAVQHVLPEFFLIKGFRGYYPETYYRYFFIFHNLFFASLGLCRSIPPQLRGSRRIKLVWINGARTGRLRISYIYFIKKQRG